MRVFLGIVLLTSIFLSAAGFSFAAEFPLQISTTPPEEAALIVNLPKVYILPDSPLYFLKKIWEGLQLVLAAEPEQRGEVLLSLAEKRLAEGISLIKKGDWQQAIVTLQNYQGQFENAQSTLNLIKDAAKYEELRQQIARQLRNQALLAAFLQKIEAPNILGDFIRIRQNELLELRPIQPNLSE
ncbi:MAG: hypothetical protein FJ044_03975 [Candidatus Cloacimonetes bacterium]|nr:hypothetical protein [Candidatus Cloacimonadota bacterium]